MELDFERVGFSIELFKAKDTGYVPADVLGWAVEEAATAISDGRCSGYSVINENTN